MKRLDGRVAVVTGAAHGIGRGIANVLAAEGARVAVADMNLSGAEQVAAALGGDAFAVDMDVADRDSVEAAVANVAERCGRIDILAANAGVYRWDPIETITDEVWNRIFDINVKGAFHCIQAALPTMRAQGYGRVVLTSSITGSMVAAPGLAHYAASKAALLGLMRNVAFEVVGDGITVNSVLPGNVRTKGIDEMDPTLRDQLERSIPLGRLAEPEEIGWAVRFLASEEAGYITGHGIVVDGGQTLPEVRS